MSTSQRAGAVSNSIYRKHILRCKDTGHYFTFDRHYFKIMGRMTALFLQDVINIAAMPRTKTATFDGFDYFFCTVNFLAESDSAWTPKEQRSHIEALRELGFVKAVRKGADGCRWIHIDLLKIEEALDKASDVTEGKNRMCPNGQNRMCPNGRVKKNTTYSQGEEEEDVARRHPSPQDRPSFDDPALEKCRHMHDRLFRILKSSKKPPAPVYDQGRKSGGGQILAGVRRWEKAGQKNAEAKVDQALDWLKDNVDKPGLPTLLNTKQFCHQLFNTGWLLNVMEKDFKANGSPERKVTTTKHANGSFTMSTPLSDEELELDKEVEYEKRKDGLWYIRRDG